MSRYVVIVEPSQTRTRLLLLDGRDEIMRAVLPSGVSLRNRRATTTFLEGLSLWLNAKLHIALSADASDASYYLELVDDLGCAAHSLYYEVELIDQVAARRKKRRLSGVGNFRDLRQLSLLAKGGGQ